MIYPKDLFYTNDLNSLLKDWFLIKKKKNKKQNKVFQKTNF